MNELTYVLQYFLEFGTYHGTQTRWRIEILRGYEGTTQPSSFLTTPETLEGTGDPITVEGIHSDDLYKPILGSKATLNLVVSRNNQYPDFSAGERWEWQLRLRERVGGTFQDYWCGFMTPLNSTEQVNTFPFTQRFVASDNLGLLEESTVNIPTAQNQQVSLLNYVTEALFQTGLGLDVYVDSGIMDGSNDALTTVTTHSHSVFTNDEQTDLVTRKQQLEGILSAFNCKIKQANGRWYIYNASTQNNTTTWNVYNYDATTNPDTYTLGTPVTENLLRTVGDSNASIVPVNQDLQVTKRRAFGSVECRPQQQVPRDLVPNGGFFEVDANQEGAPGFTFGSSAMPTNDRFDETYYLTNGRSARTTRTIRNIRPVPSDVWFEVDPVEIGDSGDVEISFDWGHRRSRGNGAFLRYQIVAMFDSVEIAELNVPTYSGLTEQQYQQMYNNGHNYFGATGTANPTTAAMTTILWNEGNQEWTTIPADTLIETQKVEDQVNMQMANWSNVSLTLRNPTTFKDPGGNTYEFSNVRIGVRFYAPALGTTRDRKRATATGEIDAYVDCVNIRNLFANDITNPVFERVNTDSSSNQTISYRPRYSSGIENAIYQRVIGENGTTTFNRRGETESLTLERIGTQQKLNDFRDVLFQYSGGFVNIGNKAISPIDKIMLNWAGLLVEGAAIQSGYRFSPRNNIYTPIFYVPNQGTDIAPGDGTITNGVVGNGFYEENVNLIAQTFPGRTGLITYTLSFSTQGLDDNGMAQTPNTLIPTEPFIQLQGFPGETVNYTLELTAIPGNELRASNLTVRDTVANPAPENVEFGPILQTGDTAKLELTITIPEDPTYEDLYISGEIDPFVADNREWDLTFALNSSVANAVITTTMRALRGPVGGVSFANVIISPSAGHELDATTFSVDGTLPTGLTLLGFSQLGTSVIGEFAAEFQATNQTATITLNGNSGTQITGGVETSVVTLDLTETITNVSTVNDLTITGVVGTVAQFNIPLYAADGFTLDSDNFSATIQAGITNVTMYDAVGGGDSVQIPVTITFPTADQTVGITLMGSAQPVGAVTTDVQVTFSLPADANFGLTELQETFTGVPGTQLSYNNVVTANTGFRISSLALGAITGDAAGATLTIDQTGVLGSINGTINFGEANRTLTIPVTATETAEPYTLQVNINNNVTNTMTSTGYVTLGYGHNEIGTAILAADQPTFTIQSNANAMAFEAATEVNTPASGGLDISYAISNGVITGTIQGTYPTPDAAGLAIVDLEINPGTGEPATTGSPTLTHATSGSFSTRVTNMPGGGGTIAISITANGAWEVGIQNTAADGVLRDLGATAIGNIAPFRGDGSGTDVNISAVPLSQQTDGDSVTSATWTIQLRQPNQGTVLDTLTLSQSRDFMPEVRFVASLPTTQIPSILYITPNA